MGVGPDSPGIRCWLSWARPEEISSDGAQSDPLLSGDDRDRILSLPADRAAEFVRGRLLIRRAIASWARSHEPGLALDAVTITSRCVVCGGRHGRPAIDGAPLVASVTHTRRATIVAVAETSECRAIGVDAEVRDARFERRRAIARITGVRRGDPLRHWTRVEAVLKADGRGLRVDPAMVRVRGGRPFATSRLAHLDGAQYELRDARGPAGHVTTVALRARA